MSTVGRFLRKTVNEFLHQCQPWVGKWSIMGKKFIDIVKERPLALRK